MLIQDSMHALCLTYIDTDNGDLIAIWPKYQAKWYTLKAFLKESEIEKIAGHAM